MDVFDLRYRLIDDYRSYVQSFINIHDERIDKRVQDELDGGLLWPDPLVQLNPAFEPGGRIDDLVAAGKLHPECSRIFRAGKKKGLAGMGAESGQDSGSRAGTDDPAGTPLLLHRHQVEAIEAAATGDNYVLTTGTGSGKSLAYIVPIVDHVLRRGSGRGIQAIVVYPMNALANSQEGELEKFLCYGYPDGKPPVTFARYTGQERDERRQEIIAHPPDILLTNYVMLELILTRPGEKDLIKAARGIRFLVLDELHTYRGRQGADVGFLVRRVRDRLAIGGRLQVVGTSATLAGPGTYDEQRAEAARVASRLFGDDVKPEHVIGETLRRATAEADPNAPAFVAALRARLEDVSRTVPETYTAYLADPVSSWIESTFGLQAEPNTGRLLRAKPRAISGPDGAAASLAELTGVPAERCEEAIQDYLLAACAPERRDPETGFPPFAFRLHQFVSRGDAVYASVEPEDDRYITVYGQQFVPGDRDRILLPLAFCRECGQEYYLVTLAKAADGMRAVAPRDLSERAAADNEEAGFLYLNTADPWPADTQELIDRLPEEWLESRDGASRIKRDQAKNLPRAIRLTPAGTEAAEGEAGVDCHFVPAPFRFCLHCGISYGARGASDFPKIGQLGSEGRSTATTILSLSAVRALKADDDLPEHARKLLSFTDNRQDASLQAGHFNDFIEIGQLRAALYRAARDAGPTRLRHDELTEKVVAALNLPLEHFAADPDVKYAALTDTRTALRNVIGYRLYRDLQRGWRITLPNLEQCGLLDMEYESLDELCATEADWQDKHPALLTASPETRASVARVLLDWMRRGLAIKVDYLDDTYQERLKQQSSQRLIAPWALDESETKLETASVVFPRSQRPRDFQGYLYLSGRSGFAQYLRRRPTFPNFDGKLTVLETEIVLRDLLEALRVAGLVEIVREARTPGDVPGYQLPASAMRWKAGDGFNPRHDPIRVPSLPEAGLRTNPFFVDFYKNVAANLRGFEAREHTAQVAYEQREDREERFRRADLPILFCSPTMELGVDIAELNVVNMRNMPPTPANYAQRSGRAGRSGQPALVYSYCSTGSPHDQYFFKRPEQMVAGAVAPPRLELANEDLARAHVQAIWLAEAGLSLGKSLKDVLDVSGDEPTLDLQDQVRDDINAEGPRRRARARAEAVLDACREDLERCDWFSPGWLDEVLNQVSERFDRACDRWRGLYRSALIQAQVQDKVIRDASRPGPDKEQAKRLRREAEQQMDLLTTVDNIMQSDFYSYRYFASEGFLPGYSFPRLPLSAFIPGSRGKKGDDEFLQRPRFLAISEFGPRAIIYHEGSRYIINKAILPVRDQDAITIRAKLCDQCGYLHPVASADGPDLCESCGVLLPPAMSQLFRLQNVSTKRRDRISSDEEERMRYGYEIVSGIRFAGEGGRVDSRRATVKAEGEPLAELTYGHAANITRINLGWARRKDKGQTGFVLDIERGYWARNQESAADDDQDDPLSPRVARVVPFVEDRRNCLLIDPAEPLDSAQAASLEAALKRAIQALYQLEDGELAVEALPDLDNPRRLLLYEAAEGGAGALRQLLDDPDALSAVAAEALRICHFDPATGSDSRRAPHAREDCEAACYDCLMSYQNQRHHQLLDRQLIKPMLLKLARAQVESSPVSSTRADHLAALKRLCGSGLEEAFLDLLERENLHLPSHAQRLVESCGTRPDFFYEDHLTAIYIDGPPHDYPERQARDAAQTEAMQDRGYTVIRFGHNDDWRAIIARYPSVFGGHK